MYGVSCSGPGGPCHVVAAVFQARSGFPLRAVLASLPLVPTKGRLVWLFRFHLAVRPGRQWEGAGSVRGHRHTEGQFCSLGDSGTGSWVVSSECRIMRFTKQPCSARLLREPDLTKSFADPGRDCWSAPTPPGAAPGPLLKSTGKFWR